VHQLSVNRFNEKPPSKPDTGLGTPGALHHIICRGIEGRKIFDLVKLTLISRLNSDLKKKSNAALLESNKRILTSIIRVLNDDSWVNVQKDLNKPFKET